MPERSSLDPTIAKYTSHTLVLKSNARVCANAAPREAGGNLQARFGFMITPCLSCVGLGTAISDPRVRGVGTVGDDGAVTAVPHAL